tara:strand:+ start:1447 stop:2055 length:609 start_codon:yes stop_codon:yes gene_type:complete
MAYDFDDGPQGSGDTGPFINWHAREKLDGSIGSRCFSLRDEDGNLTDITKKMSKGVAFDLDTLKTGWCFSNGTPGVAPEWKWNDTPARFSVKQPDDIGEDRWKKGFSIRIAVGKDQAGTWSQAGAGAWQGLVNLMKAVKADGGEGETVIAAMGDVEEIKFKKGGTSAPSFEIKKWAKRPDCLLQEAATADEPEEDGEDEDEF